MKINKGNQSPNGNNKVAQPSTKGQSLVNSNGKQFLSQKKQDRVPNHQTENGGSTLREASWIKEQLQLATKSKNGAAPTMSISSHMKLDLIQKFDHQIEAFGIDNQANASQDNTKLRETSLDDKQRRRARQRSKTRSLSRDDREDMFFEKHLYPLVMQTIVDSLIRESGHEYRKWLSKKKRKQVSQNVTQSNIKAPDGPSKIYQREAPKTISQSAAMRTSYNSRLDTSSPTATARQQTAEKQQQLALKAAALINNQPKTRSTSKEHVTNLSACQLLKDQNRMRNTSPDLVLVGGSLSNQKIALKLLWNQNDYLTSAAAVDKIQNRPAYNASQANTQYQTVLSGQTKSFKLKQFYYSNRSLGSKRSVFNSGLMNSSGYELLDPSRVSFNQQQQALQEQTDWLQRQSNLNHHSSEQQLCQEKGTKNQMLLMQKRPRATNSTFLSRNSVDNIAHMSQRSLASLVETVVGGENSRESPGDVSEGQQVSQGLSGKKDRKNQVSDSYNNRQEQQRLPEILARSSPYQKRLMQQQQLSNQMVGSSITPQKQIAESQRPIAAAPLAIQSTPQTEARQFNLQPLLKPSGRDVSGEPLLASNKNFYRSKQNIKEKQIDDSRVYDKKNFTSSPFMDEYSLMIKHADPHMTMGGGTLEAKDQMKLQKIRMKQHSQLQQSTMMPTTNKRPVAVTKSQMNLSRRSQDSSRKNSSSPSPSPVLQDVRRSQVQSESKTKFTAKVNQSSLESIKGQAYNKGVVTRKSSKPTSMVHDEPIGQCTTSLTDKKSQRQQNKFRGAKLASVELKNQLNKAPTKEDQHPELQKDYLATSVKKPAASPEYREKAEIQPVRKSRVTMQSEPRQRVISRLTNRNQNQSATQISNQQQQTTITSQPLVTINSKAPQQTVATTALGQRLQPIKRKRPDQRENIQKSPIKSTLAGSAMNTAGTPHQQVPAINGGAQQAAVPQRSHFDLLRALENQSKASGNQASNPQYHYNIYYPRPTGGYHEEVTSTQSIRFGDEANNQAYQQIPVRQQQNNNYGYPSGVRAIASRSRKKRPAYRKQKTMPNSLPSNDNDPAKLSQQEDYEEELEIDKKDDHNNEGASIVSEALTHEEDASPLMRNNVGGGIRGQQLNTQGGLQEVMDQVLPRAMEHGRKQEKQQRQHKKEGNNRQGNVTVQQIVIVQMPGASSNTNQGRQVGRGTDQQRSNLLPELNFNNQN